MSALVQHPFTPNSVTAFKPRLEAIAERCLAGASEPIDIANSLSKPLPTIAIAEFIGFDSRYHVDFKAWTNSLTKRGYPMPTERQWSEIIQADQAMRECLRQLTEERRIEANDDLVTRLIVAEEQEQKLSTEEIIDMCFLLVGAGNFATTDLISNCIFADLQIDSKVAPEALVQNIANQDSPVLAARRYAVEEISLKSDKTIERSTAVLAAANHHPGNKRRLLSFGRGVHHCLGAQLARLGAEVAVATSRRLFPDARLLSSERSKRLGFRYFRNLIVEVAA